MLPDLPNAVLFVIAEQLTKETSFRDKVDVAIDAASLSCVCKFPLANEVICLLDPMSVDGKLTSEVLENLKRKMNKRVPAQIAKLSWGLSDDDMAHLPNSIISRNNKHVTTYKLQDVKKASERKFQSNGVTLHLHTSVKQLNRTQILLNILDQPIRPDSKYCQYYIKTGKGNPQDIARLLKEMDFYHTYTTYPQLYWVYSQKYSLDYGYYDRDHISNDAKCTALRRFKTRHPDKMHIVPQTLLRFL